MRKKRVNYDGLEFTISPLNLDQVEEFIAEKPEGTPPMKTIDLLLMSLNNAEPEEPWTAERLRKELDLELQIVMQKDVLKFSGLKVAEDSAPSGEASAATGSGSGKPAAA